MSVNLLTSLFKLHLCYYYGSLILILILILTLLYNYRNGLNHFISLCNLVVPIWTRIQCDGRKRHQQLLNRRGDVKQRMQKNGRKYVW